MDKASKEALVIVEKWHEALNGQDKERMAALVSKKVIMGGPKGEVQGADQMLDWMDRAQISLTPKRYFASANLIVVEQLAEWRNATTQTSMGSQTVASAFGMRQGRIVSVHRFDDLNQAFEISGFKREG